MHVQRCQRLYRVDKVVENTLEWPLCVFTPDKQISQPRLARSWTELLAFALITHGIIFETTVLGILLSKTLPNKIFETRLGGEIARLT